MSEMFFTNPSEQKQHKLPCSSLHWEHKEQTIRELIDLGVPLRPAELSAIDYRTAFYVCQTNRLTPKQTASMIYEDIRRSYQRDGKWLHA